MPVPTPTPLTRRGFMTASAGLVGLLSSGGCATSTTESEPDPLRRLADAATRDARELAAADASHGSDADRLRRIGGVRAVHAERLTDEIEREAGGLQSLTDAVGSSGSAAPSPGRDDAAPAVCPPTDEVRRRLRADAGEAAEAAISAEGYRAELAAAVSAACTAALEVVLS
ncbi:MAG TPA: hypothetical protein H9759_12190 [Candidatus Dietzia intestinipullorum]|nr:hypothetical protein [Candidatus Dietzia intestinipullorum]